MSAAAWGVSAVLACVVGAFAWGSIPADLVMVGALAVLLLTGVLTPADALGGFASEGMITVAVLFVVAAGIRDTGALAGIAGRLLGRPRTVRAAQGRLMAPAALLSAFMNNTPLVAILLPIVSDWSRRHRLPASKLMMPLSFATILGGLCTLIGTSTNVVVNGLMVRETGSGFGMFEITRVGVPVALAGGLYMLVAGRWLLPDRRPAIQPQDDDPRSYTVEMVVAAQSPIVGRTIEEAGLRHLRSTYLMEIDRDGEVLKAVGPDTRLRAGDRLVFVGIVDSVVELTRIRGLDLASDQRFELDGPPAERGLVEAVVSDQCPLVGKSIREGRFRSLYNAVVIAVARGAERVPGKIGDIVLAPGDTLLLEANPSFVEAQRNSRAFYLVSGVEGSTPPRHDRAWVALAILIAMVALMTSRWTSEVAAAMAAATAMVLAGCVTPAAARRAVDGSVLVVIGASFGLARAVQGTGLDRVVAGALLGAAGERPWPALAAIYVMTMVFTEIMSNNAAAVLVFPIAMATAKQLGVDPTPFVMAMTVAASCGFATPIGYQTNLMVYGPGGYRFADYLRFGGLLNLVVATVAIAIVPLLWPFG